MFRFALASLALVCLASCGEPTETPVSETDHKTVQTVANSRPGSRPEDAPEGRDAPAPPPVVAVKPERDPANELREKIVGVWKQNYTGVRWLSVRPDGTATMFIDPDWIARAIIGNRLTVQIEWSVDDGRALLRSVSGEPKSAFDRVESLFGRERNRKIAELTDARFVLLDEEDGSLSEWTRVGPGEMLPAELKE